MSTTSHSCTKHDAAKHEAILNQAISFFAADGFARGDVQAIADAAGVGKGTVYRYFGNKLDLFHACTMEISKRVDERVSAAISESNSPLENVRAACMAYAQLFEDSPKYLELLVQERAEFRGVKPEQHYQYHNKMIDGFAAILQRAVDSGEIWPVDARKTVIALANLLFGNVVHTCCFNFPEGEEETPASLTEYAVDVFIRGLRKDTKTGIQDGKDEGDCNETP
jgi:AcrR family transcriptional regulator